ncbi:MAG: hypothetical protein Q9160_007456 [Pyrenula sp. 1 TL-2023]
MGGSILLYNDGNCVRHMLQGNGKPLTLKPYEKQFALDASSGSALKVWYPGDGPDATNMRETAEWSYTSSFWYDVSWITGGASGMTMGKLADTPGAATNGDMVGSTVKGNADMMGDLYREWTKEGGATGPVAGALQNIMQDPNPNSQQPFIAFTTPSNNTAFETVFRNVVNGGSGGYVATGDYYDANGNLVKGDTTDNNQSGQPIALSDTLVIHFGASCPDFNGVQAMPNRQPNPKPKRVARQQRRQRRQERLETPVEPPVAAPGAPSYAPAYAAIGQGHSIAGNLGPYAAGGIILLLALLMCSLIRDNSRLRRLAKRSQSLPDIKIGMTEA